MLSQVLILAILSELELISFLLLYYLDNRNLYRIHHIFVCLYILVISLEASVTLVPERITFVLKEIVYLWDKKE